jgi:Spy/CpxP family protein refolding chaperone
MKSNRAKTLALLFLIAGVAFVSAQGGPGMGMGNQGVMGPGAVREWFRSLNLTDEDLAKLEKILDAREIELAKAQNEIRIYQTQVANEFDRRCDIEEPWVRKDGEDNSD